MVFTSLRISVLLVAGKNSGRLGVVNTTFDGIKLDVTGLERTLVDIAVRPEYSGGASKVMRAYQQASKRIKMSSLIETLRRLEYVYPYHQAIGYYLSRAGFSPAELRPLQNLGLKFDFYLEKGVRSPGYDDTWKVHLPSGLK